MTAIAEHPVREVDLGHPIRSFTAVLIASALVLVVVQWSGESFCTSMVNVWVGPSA